VEQGSDTCTPPGIEDTNLHVRRSFERSFEAGELVFDAGDSGETFYVVQSGEVELTRPGPLGPRTVARLGPGDFFGEMSVLLGGARSERATAARQARLLELDRSTLQEMCLEQPEIAIRLIRRLAARVIDLEKRLAALGCDDQMRPVVRVLVRHAESGENGARVPMALRHIARQAGLTMLEAHGALTQLLEQRFVRLVDDELSIPDLDALFASLD
jgi:CRP-like cAMP-binding protein